VKYVHVIMGKIFDFDVTHFDVKHTVSIYYMYLYYISLIA